MPAKKSTATTRKPYAHHAPLSAADEKRAVDAVAFIRNKNTRAAASRFARKFIRHLNGDGYSPGVPGDGPVSADDVARIRATLRGAPATASKSAAPKAKATTRKPTAKPTRATK